MAGLAAAALYIKAEAAWFIAPNLGFIRRCKKGSDEIKRFPYRSPDWNEASVQ